MYFKNNVAGITLKDIAVDKAVIKIDAIDFSSNTSKSFEINGTHKLTESFNLSSFKGQVPTRA